MSSNQIENMANTSALQSQSHINDNEQKENPATSTLPSNSHINNNEQKENHSITDLSSLRAHICCGHTGYLLICNCEAQPQHLMCRKCRRDIIHGKLANINVPKKIEFWNKVADEYQYNGYMSSAVELFCLEMPTYCVCGSTECKAFRDAFNLPKQLRSKKNGPARMKQYSARIILTIKKLKIEMQKFLNDEEVNSIYFKQDGINGNSEQSHVDHANHDDLNTNQRASLGGVLSTNERAHSSCILYTNKHASANHVLNASNHTNFGHVLTNERANSSHVLNANESDPGNILDTHMIKSESQAIAANETKLHSLGAVNALNNNQILILPSNNDSCATQSLRQDQILKQNNAISCFASFTTSYINENNKLKTKNAELYKEITKLKEVIAKLETAIPRFSNVEYKEKNKRNLASIDTISTEWTLNYQIKRRLMDTKTCNIEKSETSNDCRYNSIIDVKIGKYYNNEQKEQH
ncbi:hypothetical protein RFI_17547 [Reticulomyxa filosa]|uniref:Uncharacterized protein n=1 Tax=Reticulomyxa filosa TaxID=46433 RepID=X6N2Y7_RETFI|nr:hypothetical protein RFI_17547 [Reticulomyxa filosa]|eukprot:ETO19682.1 hypothetical protein RFI_17547 [Reticulomyxa filosa]